MSQTTEDQFPTFPYNAVARHSFEKSEETCESCNQKRGYIYNGPMYGSFEDDPIICPWCIKDGSACEKLDVELVECDEELSKEFNMCTPGFTSWQGGAWWDHCGDAAEYHGMGDGGA
mmetsp:Transcript_5221/g.7557  ORF Transcript_5221/g.7557 Transcript_5221/m.7557 type:complete len:117 (+) Transcript_5221:115-465(+)